LLNSLKNHNSERYVILPCQLARDNISKKWYKNTSIYLQKFLMIFIKIYQTKSIY
jgi:hypothetical protein